MAKKNIFISCKESRIESNRSFYGCFNLGPFDSGESLTVANALRRTLLSECLGLGIVSVTIDNVTHEYSIIPGMRESVLDLILNLKEIVFKKLNNPYSLYRKNSKIYNQIGASYFKPVSGFLKVKGPGVIRAKDLKLPPFLECVDPEQYIATLAEDGFLCMKFIIMEGKGYLLQTKKSSLSAIFEEKVSTSLGSAKQGCEAFEQKNNAAFIDNDLIKNRSRLLKEIKNSSSAFKYKENKIVFFKDKKQEDLTLAKEKPQNSTLLNSNINVLSKTKAEEFNTKMPLNLDTVFNPVTKVSYIIEDFDNKIVNDLNQKVNFTSDISNLIESSYYLNKNLPFLTQEIKLNQADISIFVDTYSPSDIEKFSYFLHPLKKQESLNNIKLEVWTNGSLHPRDALYLAFEKLASTFLNMKKTQSYNIIYKNESSLLLAEKSN